MQSKGFVPGRRGLIPVDKQTARDALAAARTERKLARKRLRAERREQLHTTALTRARWWGFAVTEIPNRRFRRAALSKRLAGPYSNVMIQDAYGDDIDRNNPADMEFARRTFRPATQSHGRYYKPKGLLELPVLMQSLLVRGEFDGWDPRTA